MPWYLRKWKLPQLEESNGICSYTNINVKELQELSNVREELTCLDNVLLQYDRIVMPAKLRDKAVALTL
jgi:hypothetical protein